jgi:putative sterol carrier protein
VIQDSSSSGQVLSLSESVKGNRLLMTFSLPWSPLAKAGEQDLSRVFENLGQQIGASEEKAQVHFGIIEGDETRSWSLEIGPDGSAVRAERVHNPDLEVLVQKEVWWQIVQGVLSPLEAFSEGKMRVIGDLNVGRKIAMRLQTHSEGM